ncbi:cobalamin (vitamin B12) biosynthesis protein CobW [Clostridium aceticum]|uniref:Cobalamin (Vitamin B12) biosynthesis protein CobW n=1 Tax=Clostridium aceticum TaxID=84022 RepID=A0A0D8I8Z6_9CLOT|nr:GTP-binding protein [Clostridium aceticum]AKL95702.1 cobalamin (vitamin B12) biosynthesis protein CobW [Clostridium aceticum]KJF26743.1 cobalamin biosynthesis protein P47K [Clostridium aceticum]
MSTKISIISGFLGAGKTTFLRKVIPNMEGKTVLIENEFGNVGIDGDLMEGQLPIKEIYAGCICCSVVQDFKKAIEELTLEYRPDHILIEPSGVGSLSDIVKVCSKLSEKPSMGISVHQLITIVDVSAFDDYLESFGAFYLDQIRNAHIIFLSHFDKLDHEEVEKVISQIRLNNPTAFILKEDWYGYDGEKIIEILNTVENCSVDPKEKSLLSPASRMFGTFSIVSPRVFSEEELNNLLIALKNKEYGGILRAKGILELDSKRFVHFDFTPHHHYWKYLENTKQTKVAVIGSNLNKEKIAEEFQQ